MEERKWPTKWTGPWEVHKESQLLFGPFSTAVSTWSLRNWALTKEPCALPSLAAGTEKGASGPSKIASNPTLPLTNCITQQSPASQGLHVLICKVDDKLSTGTRFMGTKYIHTPAPDSFHRWQVLSYLSPITPSQASLQILSWKNRIESWTQTWPIFSAKSPVFQARKRDDSRDVPHQLARAQPDASPWKLLTEEGSWVCFPSKSRQEPAGHLDSGSSCQNRNF